MSGTLDSILGGALTGEEPPELVVGTVVPTTLPFATSAPLPPAAVRTPPPGQPPSTGSFLDALGKAKTATKYRIQFAWLFGETKSGKYQETPFIDMTGEVDGANSHFTSKGGLLAIFAGDGSGTVEIITAAGKTYMRGVNMFGLTDPKVWYITDSSATSGFSDFAKPDEYKDFVSGAKESDFRKVRTESLDGQSCDVYLYDMKSAQNAAIVGMLGTSKDKNAFSAIDKAEISIWLCGDGFVHKYVLDYQGHDANNPNEKGALKINAHMWDFNNPTITIQAPKDAKPLPGTR
jgi:hypothetical protein